MFTLTADDGVNPPVSDSMTATLTNVPPDMLIMQPNTGKTYPYDAQAVFEAHVYDFGLNDTLSCTIAWGDGATSVAMVVGKSCMATHQYDPGFYHLLVTAADDDGGMETLGPLWIPVTPPRPTAPTAGGSSRRTAALPLSISPCNGSQLRRRRTTRRHQRRTSSRRRVPYERRVSQ